MRLLTVLAPLFLGGCTAMYKPPYEIKPPQEIETYTKGYQVHQGYSGYEVTFGFPFLGWIPVAGPYISQIIQFRSGVRQDIIVPVMEESQYEHEARIRMGSPGPLRFVPGCVQQHQR